MRALILAFALLAGPAMAANPEVGGAAMFETKNIVENAVNSKDHTTLVAAVKAAGLVDALQGAGPFTVFAPVNAGFDALPAGTVETLLKPENKDLLTKVLTAHVVAGKFSAADIAKKIKVKLILKRRSARTPRNSIVRPYIRQRILISFFVMLFLAFNIHSLPCLSSLKHLIKGIM